MFEMNSRIVLNQICDKKKSFSVEIKNMSSQNYYELFEERS